MQEKKHANVKIILKELANLANVKRIQGLADYLGAPVNTLYGWISRGHIADPALILRKLPNVRIEWLETGEGEMLQQTAVRDPGEVYIAETKTASTLEAVEELLADINMSDEAKEQVRKFVKEAESQLCQTAQSMAYALGGIPRNLKP